jgi:polysaccharide lyase-like protein
MARLGFVALVLSALAPTLACSYLVDPRQPAKSENPVASPVTTVPSPHGAPAGVSLRDDLGFFGNGLTFTNHGSFGLDRGTVLPPTEGAPGAVLRVTYPAGAASKRAEAEDGTADGGVQAYLRLPHDSQDQARLRYYVRFQPGFDFVKGGKLPGLYGGTVTSGRKIPNGTNGFSTRYMWRTGGAGEVYAYLPSSVEHGTSLGRGSWQFVPGRWTLTEQEVRLNTPGQADGSITVWVDGNQVFQQNGLVYRTTRDLKIDGLFFSTFFGGGDSSWASPSDQYAEFAEFSLRPVLTGGRLGTESGA